MSPLGFDRKEEPRGDMIIRLIIIISIAAVSTLQIPPNVMAQASSGLLPGGAYVGIEDGILAYRKTNICLLFY